MSMNEILEELPRLTESERLEIREQLDRMDEPVLSEEERRVVEARLADCARHPNRFVPWDEARTQLLARFKP